MVLDGERECVGGVGLQVPVVSCESEAEAERVMVGVAVWGSEGDSVPVPDQVRVGAAVAVRDAEKERFVAEKTAEAVAEAWGEGLEVGDPLKEGERSMDLVAVLVRLGIADREADREALAVGDGVAVRVVREWEAEGPVGVCVGEGAGLQLPVGLRLREELPERVCRAERVWLMVQVRVSVREWVGEGVREGRVGVRVVDSDTVVRVTVWEGAVRVENEAVRVDRVWLAGDGEAVRETVAEKVLVALREAEAVGVLQVAVGPVALPLPERVMVGDRDQLVVWEELGVRVGLPEEEPVGVRVKLRVCEWLPVPVGDVLKVSVGVAVALVVVDRETVTEPREPGERWSGRELMEGRQGGRGEGSEVGREGGREGRREGEKGEGRDGLQRVPL